jgi:putative hydrolase of the HAD superfamily
MTPQPIAVFDLGMVLAEPIGLYEGLAQLLGVSAQQLQDVYYIHRRIYDTGLPDRDYWTRTVAELGVTVDVAALLPQLVATDMASWSVIRPGAAAILEDLNQAGLPVVVLSNAPASFALRAPGLPWYGLAQQWFFSASLGLTKPDPGIYRHVEQALKCRPQQLWFVDDRPENVAGAIDCGWQAHLWKNDADTRAWLERAGLLPPN